ncbi:MAG: acetate/propionate family kinase [Pseudomonadota bacterium]
MSNRDPAVLAVNAGSSTLKFALYRHRATRVDAACLSGTFGALEPGGTPYLHLCTERGERSTPLAASGDSFGAALAALAGVLDAHADGIRVDAIAHRIVHGGARCSDSLVIDDGVLAYLDTLAPLAPLHQRHNLDGVRAFRAAFPQLPQVACFDTGFHASISPIDTTYALPAEARQGGVRRYGFHGLSYRYVTARLAEYSGHANARLLVAHLGNGASACAIAQGRSVATSMGFSALDGLVMGTRCGALDPGVLLHLLRSGWSVERLEEMLYRESGLLGLSGVSADMRTLHASAAPEAALAIDVFVHRLVRECGALTACLGGLEVLAFTGGIGEHDCELRARACAALAYLGVRIDAGANRDAIGNATLAIHAPESKVEVWVVPTDEGRVAAGDAARLIAT